MSDEIKNTLPMENSEYIASQNAIIRNRIDKMNAFREEGLDVYATGFQPTDRAAELKKLYGNETHESLEEKNVHAVLAGRIMNIRVFGKGSFAVLKDATGSIQIHVGRDGVGEETYARYKKFDMGDIVGV